MTDTPKDPQVGEYIEGMRAWRAELEALRAVLLGAGLDEELKWYKPCYSHGGSNVVIFQPFKELCALLFFKGALLEDRRRTETAGREHPLRAASGVPLRR